jgi:hypothetical protein
MDMIDIVEGIFDSFREFERLRNMRGNGMLIL